MRCGCEREDKILYSDRGEARKARQKLRHRNLHVYPCPSGNGFHLGHMPEVIRSGRMTRDRVFPREDQSA